MKNCEREDNRQSVKLRKCPTSKMKKRKINMFSMSKLDGRNDSTAIYGTLVENSMTLSQTVRILIKTIFKRQI